LFTVTSIKAVKCILPLLFDSPPHFDEHSEGDQYLN